MSENNTHENIHERKSQVGKGTQKDSLQKGAKKGTKDQEMPVFAQESAEEVFKRRGENVKVIRGKIGKDFEIELTTVDENGKIVVKNGWISLEDVKDQDAELYKDLEHNTKIHYIASFMSDKGINISDIRIIDGEYTFKNENGQEIKLDANEKKEFKEKLEEAFSPFGFDANNLDIPNFVRKTVLEKVKNLPEDQGGGDYDGVYDYDEKRQKWYLQKGEQIREAWFDKGNKREQREQRQIFLLNSKMRGLNLDRLEKEEDIQITSVDDIKGGYRVSYSKGGEHDYYDYTEISPGFRERVKNDAATGTLGDSPRTRDEKVLARDEVRWEEFKKVVNSADQFFKGLQTDEQRSWWIDYIEHRRNNEFARRKAMLEVRPIGKAGEEELREIEQKIEKLIDNLKTVGKSE